MESMALDRNSIFHAKDMCLRLCRLVCLLMKRPQVTHNFIVYANLNEERVKTKCSGSKKPTKKSNVKTVTKATKMNKKLQNTNRP